jgi:hypothetical protein
VVGIEPNPEMLAVAAAATGAANVVPAGLRVGDGIEGSSVDICTCSQSLQWMEPEPTFAEIARILGDEPSPWLLG